MDQAESWNYALIPPRQWVWDLAERHWMEAHIGPNGLTYIGTDWSIQSGGGYFGGFQSFDEFLDEGPPSELHMLEESAAEVREYLLTHRTAGGAALRLLHLNQATDLVPWRFFIHLDEQPIKMATTLSTSAAEWLLFEGSLPVGEHELGYALIFRAQQGRKKGQWSAEGEQRFTVQAGQRTLLTLTTWRDETDLYSSFSQSEEPL